MQVSHCQALPTSFRPHHSSADTPLSPAVPLLHLTKQRWATGLNCIVRLQRRISIEDTQLPFTCDLRENLIGDPAVEPIPELELMLCVPTMLRASLAAWTTMMRNPAPIQLFAVLHQGSGLLIWFNAKHTYKKMPFATIFWGQWLLQQLQHFIPASKQLPQHPTVLVKPALQWAGRTASLLHMLKV